MFAIIITLAVIRRDREWDVCSTKSITSLKIEEERIREIVWQLVLNLCVWWLCLQAINKTNSSNYRLNSHVFLCCCCCCFDEIEWIKKLGTPETTQHRAQRKTVANCLFANYLPSSFVYINWLTAINCIIFIYLLTDWIPFCLLETDRAIEQTRKSSNNSGMYNVQEGMYTNSS